MTTWWTRRPVVVLLVLLAAGGIALAAIPHGGRVDGLWPVGIAAGVLVLAQGRAWRQVPLGPPVLVAIAALAYITSLDGSRSAEVSLGHALAITLECWVVARMLGDGTGDRPRLRSDSDLGRLVAASIAGALVGGGGGMATALLTGTGVPIQVGLTLGWGHLASLLTLLPFFTDLPDHDGVVRPAERIAQWTALLVLTPMFFTISEVPLLVVLVIPLLAWGALRVSALESLAQLLFVLFVAVQLTRAGISPLADIPERYGLFAGAPVVLLGVYAVTCSLVVLPLLLRVGQHLAAERQVATERDVIRSIVDGAQGVAIIGADEHGLITLFNPGAERLLGYTAEEVQGRPVRDFYPPDAVAAKAADFGLPADFRALAGRLSDPGTGPVRIPVRRKDGELRLHLMTLSRLQDDRGRVTGFVSTSEDVTELLEAQRRLEDSLRTERDALERLRQVDIVKDSFVSSVSHELRTPITSIVGFLELLQDGSYGQLSAPQDDAVGRIHTNTGRLLALIDDLLTLSRLQEQVAGDEATEFDLRDAVRAGHVVVAPAWAPPRVLDVRLDLPTERLPFSGDQDAIERVVVNLLGNAVKFTPDGGRVWVRLALEDGWLAVLEVSDTGIGIPAEEEHMLFSRFFRSSTATDNAVPGTGLGLSISQTIVEQHDGTISMRARPGGGSTFTVRLPVGTEQPARRLTEESPAEESVRPEPER